MKTLNIKDPEAHRLAAEIAKETGESLTHVVTEALRDRYLSLHPKPKQTTLNELIELAQRVSQLAKPEPFDHGTLLYDEDGLPN